MLHTLRAAGGMLVLILVSMTLSAQVTWNQTFSDEFGGAAGTGPDLTKWAYDSPTAGASNNELEIYCGQAGAGQSGDCTDYLKNAHADGLGSLVISAVKSPSGQWTSARLLTHGTFTFTYGRAEASIKLPSAPGLWPAYWMLGDNIFSGTNWPACGEADMMENVPSLGPTVTQSSLNGPNYNGRSSIFAKYSFPSGQRIDTAYHIYGVIWGPDLIQYYVDSPSQPFASFTPANLPRRGTWVYNDHPFFMLLNLAVGGSWPGPPDSTTPNPANMYVDYVRVYAPGTGLAGNLGASPTSKTSITLSWNASSTPGASYKVYASTAQGFLPGAATLKVSGLTGTSYVVTGLNARTVYYFRVVASAASGDSLPSNIGTATTPGALIYVSSFNCKIKFNCPALAELGRGAHFGSHGGCPGVEAEVI